MRLNQSISFFSFVSEKGFSTDLPNLLGIPRVKIPEGQGRYLLLMAHSHGYTGFGRTIVRGADVENHLQIFDQTLEEMEPQGICAKCLGGGMIHNDVSGKKIRIYGFSSTFGNADHFRTKNILQSWSTFRDFEIIIDN
ncbi:hypothetical protein KR038_004482 [Drosophila bunnanda]|nr:hypothetical protein KR038_004482 [Drosophila bunnanda]